VVGENLDWELGMFWEMDKQNQRLRFVDLWHAPDVEADEFIKDSKDRTFTRGEGLVGRVWATGKSMWIPDVCADPGFRRADMAARAGLHGAFAFPVSKGERLYGVIDCFTRTRREPDPDVLEMLADLGIKVGVFVDRKRTEQELRETEARSSRRNGSPKWRGCWATSGMTSKICSCPSPGAPSCSKRNCANVLAHCRRQRPRPSNPRARGPMN
jgi:GAF domain-containing protein